MIAWRGCQGCSFAITASPRVLLRLVRVNLLPIAIIPLGINPGIIPQTKPT